MSANRIAGPAFQYAGSKWRLAPWILRHFPEHTTYVEAFAGTASVLLRKLPSPREVLNDIDGHLVNFYQVLRDQPDALIHALSLTPFSRVEFERARSVLTRPADDSTTPLDRARLVMVFHAQNYGAFDSWSMERTDSGLHRRWLTMHAKLLAIAERLSGCTLESRPAVQVVRAYDSPTTLVYADPPYVHSTRPGGTVYLHEMDDAAHRELLTALCDCRAAVVLSGYQSPLYRKLLRGWTRRHRWVYSSLSAGFKGGTSRDSRRRETLWIKPARP